MNITLREDMHLEQEQVIALYKANEWSSAEKPVQLMQGLLHSHSLVTAYDQDQLIGLGNALSDGYLVVYYPHLLVHPYYQRKGIGKMIMDKLQQRYNGFHQHILVADGRAVDFYLKCGFAKAGENQAMWIYKGNDH